MSRATFRRWLTTLLALAILALTAGEGWHHHAEVEKSDCAYCQFTGTRVDSSHVAPPASLAPTGFVSTAFSYIAETRLPLVLHFPSGRSPPQAS